MELCTPPEERQGQAREEGCEVGERESTEEEVEEKVGDNVDEVKVEEEEVVLLSQPIRGFKY